MLKSETNNQADQTVSLSLPPNHNTDKDLLKLKNQLSSYFLKFMQDLKKDSKMNDYLKQISLTTEIILESYQKIIETNEKLLINAENSPVIYHAAQTYFNFLLALMKAKSTQGLDSKGRLVWYIEVEAKLHCCLELFHNYKEKEDITSSPMERYPKVWQRCRFQPASNAKNVKQQYKEMKKMMHIATSASIIESNYSLSLVQKIVFGLSFPRYLIMNDQAKLKSLHYYRNPTLQFAQKLWNLPQLGATRQLSKITYDSIKTNMKLYIPADGKYEHNLNIFEERPNTIVVRLLHNKKIEKFPEMERSGCCIGENRKVQYLQEIIFHMHGGGFIALSSRSMQVYTRKWANQLNTPVFSVDYRMPPDHPFPQAPNDCFTVYQFLINHIDKFINIRPKSIYVAGDSAGGSLCCSLTGLILKHKQLIPKGLYLIYPAADLRFIFSSSRLYSLTDPLLWPSTLIMCLNSYLNGDHQKAKDPIASPILLTEQYVNGSDDKRFPLKWPKTVIAVGNRDPLYDDSLMLMHQMVQSGIDCQCIIYQELSHGFMNTGLMVKQTQKTLDKSVDHLRKLIKQTSQK